jgi:predicted acyl esterase
MLNRFLTARPAGAALALLALACSCLASPVVAGCAAPQQAGETRTYMVPMRDGVRLATDVCLPEAQGPWAVVLQRTCYGRSRRAGRLEHYAIVTQDVRGRGDSEGHARPFLDDGWGQLQDGLDTVNWILAQPWCNGKIGTLGPSALGITQNLLAGTDPPGVVCQSISIAAGSLYHHMVYPGGCFRESLVAGWLAEVKWPEENLDRIRAHPFYDQLWESVDSISEIKRKNVSIPALHWGGWFDIFTQGTIDSFVSRSQVSPNQWMVIGPASHGSLGEVGELVFPPNAVELPIITKDRQLWFDFWLGGASTGLRQIPRVHYYVMGACGEEDAPGNEWRTAGSWPVPATPVSLFFASDGQLVENMPSVAGSTSYNYDPGDPVPTRGGANWEIPDGPMDQRELEGRADVLVFSTAPLEDPVEVTGRVRVRLYASSSAEDTMFTAKLCDVYPDGRSMLLTDGALRAACRESVSAASPLEPEQTYEFNIDLGSTSMIFNRGHRIRVDISSSNAPRFAVHPNVWGEGEPRVARQTLYRGGDHPSAVILPVVGSADLRCGQAESIPAAEGR